MAGTLRVADLKRAASIETVSDLTARVAQLEAQVTQMAARLDRLEAARANGARKDDESEYEIGSLIG